MSKGKLLVIDDEERLRKLLARILQLEEFDVIEAATAKEGLRKLEHEVVDVVISDVKLPDGNGIDLTKTIKAAYPAIEIIVLTAYGTINDGVTSIKNGAFDYITKGDDNEKIIPLVNKAMDKAILQRRVLDLENKLSTKFGFDRIIGTSPAITAAIKLAQRVAATDTTVLILVHLLKNYWRVNCSATKPAHLPARLRIKKDCWKKPTAAPYFWTR
jgi:two-component system NtrC family response regulator